jgi:hypothetical protein
MKQQQMLKIVLINLVLLAAIYILSGCGARMKNHAAHPISQTGKQNAMVAAPRPGYVTFIIRGIVLGQTANGLVGFSPSYPHHVGLFGDRNAAPVPAPEDPCTVTIEVDVQGLQSPPAATTIGDAFDPVLFRRTGWQGISKSLKPFVTANFGVRARSIQPGPYDPKEWAVIQFGDGQKKPVLAPESAILTFVSSDLNKVSVKRTETRNCANPKDNTRTETVEKLTDDTYFLGIGLPQGFMGDGPAHAIGYFDKILCEIYGDCKAVPKERRIFSTKSLSSRQRQAPHLVYAAFTNASLMMLAVENCAVPVAVVTSP